MLKMTNPVRFTSSFNRLNLKYSVEQKSGSAKKAREQLVEKIKTSYRGKCGIVYCFSQYECEQVAAALQENGIRSDFYHAGDENERRHYCILSISFNLD